MSGTGASGVGRAVQLDCEFHGSKVDEGSVHPSVIGGKDYGQLLYTLGVLGWLMLLTVPGGTFAFIIWLVVLLIHRSNWRNRLSTHVS